MKLLMKSRSFADVPAGPPSQQGSVFAWPSLLLPDERGGDPLDYLHRRLDHLFVRLMYAQWIVAIGLSAWYTPHTDIGQHVSVAVLLSWAFLCGGVATLVPVLAARLWPGQRKTRVVIAMSQVLMATVVSHLVGSNSQMYLHIYASLGLLAFYADPILVPIASACVVAGELLRRITGQFFLWHLRAHKTHLLRECGWLLLCNALALWTGRERRMESRRLVEQQQQQQELFHRAFHDMITGLPNRAAVESHMDERLDAGAQISCMVIDIDGFRAANELMGHRGGDSLMRSIMARVQDCVRHDDLLGRFAGDRFVVLVDEPHTRQQLAALAESIVHSTAVPHVLEGRSITNSVSIGIASFPADATDRETMLAAADRAMHAVKCDGRNSYRFAADMRQAQINDEHNKNISTKLQRALLEGGLQLVYQPIFTGSETMVAVEALARWHDREEGHISPAEFVPVAEATGLIVPLSNWVLREACEQMVRWVGLGTTLDRMAVNVSVKQVWRNDFVATVERTLRETGLDPHHLELELTEGALATDFETVKQNLRALRRTGVRISIDDFGTGYSSLSRLRELDADVLKVDRMFVQGASDTPSGQAVVQAIIDMAHRLRLTVIAEGVETTEQLQMLRGMNCDEIQGFLLSRPQPPELLTASLRNAGARTRSERSLMKLIPRTA